MIKRLLVGFLLVAAVASLTACGGGESVDTAPQSVEAAPVELEVANPAMSESSAASDELLDPEFGCNGGGSLEYGLVDRPDLD
jgi:hypothetical protein